MDDITVKLGGREYSIKRLPVRKSKAWRTRFSSEFDRVAGDILQLTNWETISLGDAKSAIIAGKDAIFRVLDEIAFELVCDYAPEIAQDRERIEDEAYDNEIVEAFVKVLGLAFPLDTLVKTLRGLTASMT